MNQVKSVDRKIKKKPWASVILERFLAVASSVFRLAPIWFPFALWFYVEWLRGYAIESTKAFDFATHYILALFGVTYYLRAVKAEEAYPSLFEVPNIRYFKNNSLEKIWPLYLKSLYLDGRKKVVEGGGFLLFIFGLPLLLIKEVEWLHGYELPGELASFLGLAGFLLAGFAVLAALNEGRENRAQHGSNS